MLGFSKMVCALAGSWYSNPTVNAVYFMNRERTLAQLAETDGTYSDGGQLSFVEFVDGRWRTTKLLYSWVY